jgi:hypothetical protein
MEKKVGEAFSEGMAARLPTRGDFLKVLGAAGVGAAVGSNALLREALSAERLVSNPRPTDLTFSIKKQYRPFDLLAKNFVQLRDGFDSDTRGNYAVLAPSPESNRGNASISRGALRVNGDSYFALFRSTTSQDAPFSTVIVDVERFSGTTGPENTVFAGLVKDQSNYVTAFYNNSTKKAGLSVCVNGAVTTLGTVDATLAAPLRFAFVANENEVTALVGDGSSAIGNFRPLIKRNASIYDHGTPDTADDTPTGLDLRDKTVLKDYKNGFGVRATSGAIALGGVEAGYYGECGVRDPHVVQYADGTPYIKDNKLYFTLTNAGLGFFEKAHWGVWRMDLSDYTNIEQVGNIFWTNDGDPTKVLGHHAGQIVRDEAKGRWIVLVSSWGDFGPQGGDRALTPGVVTQNPANPPVDILYAEPGSINPLEGVHVLTGKRHPVNEVPYKTEGKWDPGITRIGDRWYFAYVIANDLFTDFQPALARSAVGADHTALTFVGTDAGKRATEGPIIQKLGSQWRVLASCGDDEPDELGFDNKYPMYTLDMRFDGYLNAPHPTNIPHPMVVPIPLSTGNTKYIMITFNGTQYYEPLLGYGTHGDFIVMEAAQVMRGYAFPPR